MSSVKHISDNSDAVICQGYLAKRSRLNNWKKKWVVLGSNQLRYYNDSLANTPTKAFHISNIRGFSIVSDTHCVFTIYTHNSLVKLQCEEAVSFRSWIDGLERFFQKKHELNQRAPPVNFLEARRKSSSGSSGSSAYSSSGSSLSLRGRSRRLDDIQESDTGAPNVSPPISKAQSPPINSNKMSESIIEKGTLYLKNKAWIVVEAVLTTKALYLLDSINKKNLVTISTAQLADVVDFESKKWLYLIAENHRGLKIGFASSAEHIRWMVLFRATIESRYRV